MENLVNNHLVIKLAAKTHFVLSPILIPFYIDPNCSYKFRSVQVLNFLVKIRRHAKKIAFAKCFNKQHPIFNFPCVSPQL